MNKRTVLSIFGVLALITSLVVSYFLFFKIPSIKTIVKDVDTSSLEGQMEFINISEKDVSFLTYRNTAFAKVGKDDITAKVITEQIINGEISSLYWYPDGKRVLLEIVNDPTALVGYSDYKDVNTAMVYATYKLGDKNPVFLDSVPGYTWLTGSQIFSLLNGDVYQYSNGLWKKSNVKLSTDKPILSTAGGSFADYFGEKLILFDSELKIIRELKQKFEEPSRIRVFDNGDLVYIDTKSLSLFRNGKASSNVKLATEDQVAAGANCFIYSQGSKNYIYVAAKSKTYQIDYNIEKIDYYKLFGLNNNGVIHFSGDSYVGKLFRFEDVE